MGFWYLEQAATVDEGAREAARAHSDQLTKPPGSLGRLESLVVDLAGLQRRALPAVEHCAITVFAADHGVAAEGVSAFPQVVTAEMVRNFSQGGAAITVLARKLGASFTVVNVGTVSSLEAMPGVLDRRIASGTGNFMVGSAMTVEQCEQAMGIGREAVQQLGAMDLFIGGEMGIANTCSAAALACALLGAELEHMVGRGTGINSEGLQRKTAVIAQALRCHCTSREPMQVLQNLGGFEIAALVGAYISAAQQATAVLVDGFICSVAALLAVAINPSVRPWLLFSHQSAEAGHQKVLEAMQAQPMLQLDLRLGEGSGAALALPLLQMACTLHSDMASFQAAGVSTEGNS